MDTCASNSELVEPQPKPERTLNRRRRRRNRRVPYDQRNNPPQHLRIVSSPILDINHFRHFLVTLENIYPMDDEPMWAADRDVAPTSGSAITIPETANKFAIKADLGASINLMSYSLYAKLSLETLKPTKMNARLADRSFQYPFGIAENMLVEVGKFTFPADFVILEIEEDSKVPLILGRPFLHTADAVIRVKQKQLKLRVRIERMIFNIDSAMKHSYSNDDTCFGIDVIDEILEEDFDALLDEVVDCPWVSPIHCVPKKGGITIVTNENDELVPIRTVTGWRMPFGLCNAPATFQRCMLVIFHDMIEESIEVFMDDFSIFENSFKTFLINLDKMIQRCKDAHLVLNWEKCHFIVKEGIVLGHKVSSAGLEVDKAKIDVISKLPPLLI
nr:reverse transcriptase domain-containing protein [Tanacetum cinerariifolium]